MKNAYVNVNGQIFSPEQVKEQAKICIFDRGFMYGDSLYEVMRTYEQRPFQIKEHMERLQASSKLCSMNLNQSVNDYEREIHRTLRVFLDDPRFKSEEAYIRIIVTRGLGRIGFGLNYLESPTNFVIIVIPLDPVLPVKVDTGMTLKVSARLRNDRRALDPAMKSGNYLNSLLAYLDAREGKFDDALLCNSNQHLTEGTTFNIFYIRRGIVATPPLDVGILDGITRRDLLRLLSNMGVETREVLFSKERLYEADEVFVTSTLKEVYPVIQVDNVSIRKGKPGPLTQKFREEYRKWALAK